MADAHGLLAVGGDLTRERLLDAYRTGIFPWYSEGDPVLWWSPDPRLVIYPGKLHIPTRLHRWMRAHPFVVTIDAAFDRVINACASVPRPRQGGTWITPEMIGAYIGLHRAGDAHSLECWRNGELVGGIYGVAMGRCFFGESMFSHESNASKIALIALVHRMRDFGYCFLDCQMPNPHLDQFRPATISRDEFLRMLEPAVQEPEPQQMWNETTIGAPFVT